MNCPSPNSIPCDSKGHSWGCESSGPMRWNLGWTDNDSFRRDQFDLPRPVEGSAEDMGANFWTQFITLQQSGIPRMWVWGTERVQPSWFHAGIGWSWRSGKALPCGQEHPHPREWVPALFTKKSCEENGATGEGCWRAQCSLGVPGQP